MKLTGIESRLEYGIDSLLATDTAQPGKLGANDERRKVLAIAIHGEVMTWQILANPIRDLFRGQHDGLGP
jgi:hypothetical protein